MTGASFTGLTVNAKDELAVKAPSVTLTTIFAKPFWFKAGLNVTVQFGAVPPKTIFATGNNVVFDDVAETDVVQLNTLSTSVIVNAMAAVAVSSFVD